MLTQWTLPDSLRPLQTGSRARRCPASLRGEGRRPATVKAREGVAYLWVESYGQRDRALAARLGVQPPAISKAARRGAVAAARWTPSIAARRKDI